jgi:hypothetical protein
MGDASLTARIERGNAALREAGFNVPHEVSPGITLCFNTAPNNTATVRFQIGADGNLIAPDPIPNPWPHRLQKLVDESVLCELQYPPVSKQTSGREPELIGYHLLSEWSRVRVPPGSGL